MSTPNVQHTVLDDKSHVDGKVKRMQGFLKKIKTRRTSPPPSPPPTKLAEPVKEEVKDQVTHEKSEETLLRQYEKDVKSALTYYKVILQKGFIQKLPGTATAVLESIINAGETIENCLRLLFKVKEFEKDTESVKPLKDNLNRSITHLIRISDDVLFDSYVHVNIDKASAFKAADALSLSLGSLYEFVLPRIRKYSLNEELLHCSASHHSSANSLDALDNISETDILDDYPQSNLELRTSNSMSKFNRDSGVYSEGITNYRSETNLSSTSDPPPKPPLPNGNRMFYGNFSNPHIRKAVSHPGDIASDFTGLKENKKKIRPKSDLHGGSPKYLDANTPYNHFSNQSSRSSLSTMSNSSLSPSKVSNNDDDAFFDSDSSIKRRINSQSESMDAESINHEEMGLSSETFTQIQKYSDKYELLAKSTLSLFNDDEDDDLLSPVSCDENMPPLLPKKKAKHTVDNYLTIMEGYAASDYNERPSSFYDNLPVPNVHNITEDELINGMPKLPPKRGSYSGRSNDDDSGSRSPFKSSRVIKKHRNSRRESSGIYEEDNVPALDCKDVSHLIIFKDEETGPLLCGGTVDALIVYVSEVDPESLYYKAFLATYRTFVSPMELICKLLYRANRFRDKGSLHISHSVLRILVKVMDEMFEELDKSLFDQLRSQVHRLLNLGELKLAKSLRDKIVNYCIKLQVNRMPIYQPVSSEKELFDFKSNDLAQQMSVLDADYFIKIELPEILRWGKEQSETLSPNLSRFIGHFNSMSFWVRTLILNETRQQEREKMYKKFLKIMRILRKLSNFSSFLAILSALDSTPVRRLEWPKQYTELLAEDCHLIDSTSAFKSYRQALAEAKPPCIPYLGLILTDITFVHLGNPQDLPDGKVNFVKRWQQYNILDSVRRFKEQLYDFPRNEKILDFFNEYEDHMDEDEMWQKSLLLKPRGK